MIGLEKSRGGKTNRLVSLQLGDMKIFQPRKFMSPSGDMNFLGGQIFMSPSNWAINV